MKKRIAIQGYEGSFHQAAAALYWGQDISVIPCATFRGLVQTLQHSSNCDAAVMAIENSIAGSILPNYNLLHASGLAITGEVYLEIRQNLLACKGVQLQDITEVHSHPMAILQCLDFLDRYPEWRVVETADTALSARNIAADDSRNIAAIASRTAAELFDMDIIAADIHTLENNNTRFLVLERREQRAVTGIGNKASVYFQVANAKGALAAILQLIAGAGVSLSKLQSYPIPGSSWQYSFHADMEFEDPRTFEAAMKTIKPLTAQLNVYGIYQKGIVFLPTQSKL